MSEQPFSRRRALQGLGTLFAAAPLAHAREAAAQAQPPAAPPVRLPPAEELVNLFEFEDAAKSKLDRAVYATIAGSDHDPFDRMTFRPRVMVRSTPLDLTTELFGVKMFTPIIVGPIAQQRQFHEEAELGTVKGAEAAKALVVVSSHSSEPIDRIAAQTKAPLWYQVYSEGDAKAIRAQIQQAQTAGVKALCITLGSDKSSAARTAPARPDWRALAALRQGIDLPTLLKGVMTEEAAKEALDHGFQGIVVSNGGASGKVSPIEALPAIATAVGGKVPILVDGSFRRGSDVIKALALGAQAVMLGRPTMWALSAYGSNGVKVMLEMLQSELARIMVVTGRPTIKLIDGSLLKMHRPTVS